MALMSALSGAFAGAAPDPAKWLVQNGAPTVSGGVLQLSVGDQITSYPDPRTFDSFAIRYDAGNASGGTIHIYDEDTFDVADWVVAQDPDTYATTIVAVSVYLGDYQASDPVSYDPAAHAWLKAHTETRAGLPTIVWSTSPNGAAWTELHARTATLGQCYVQIGAADTPAESPLDAPPYDYEDPGDDYADMPAEDEPECATLLELIQAFSAAVRRAVRITGPRTITMVDPIAPLPAGWAQADAPTLYHASTRAFAAGQKVLSSSAGDLALTGSADLLADDVRLVVSGWRVPDRLPVYGLHPAPVQRVTYTFTPEGCTTTVEYAFHTVPSEVRRT